MKKTLTVLASAVLALGMLFVMGCKQPTLNAEDSKNWKSVDEGKGPKKLTIEVDNGPIKWWAVTDMKNAVIKSGGVTSEGKIELTLNTYDLPTSENVQYTKDKAEVVLWINQSSFTNDPENKKELTNKVLRGAIKISATKGATVKASKYGEAIDQEVGLLNVTCGEYNNKKWNGNYHITESVPLKLVSGTSMNDPNAQFEFISGLKVTKIIEEKGTAQFVWPAGKTKFAIKQPDRFNPGKAYEKCDGDKDAKEQAKATEQAAANKQASWYWVTDVDVTEWSTIPATVDSKKCLTAVSLDGKLPEDQANSRSIGNAFVVVSDSDFITPDEVVEMR